jgi:hypothetical protein
MVEGQMARGEKCTVKLEINRVKKEGADGGGSAVTYGV